MAKKKHPDTLSHTEILCLALNWCESEIRRINETFTNPDHADLLTEDLRRKRDHLLNLYRLETGMDY